MTPSSTLSTLLVSFFLISSSINANAAPLNDSVTAAKPATAPTVRKKTRTVIPDDAPKTWNHTEKGYRLMILNTLDRNKAAAAKTLIYTKYPELKPYLLYQSPYFKLKVGNFLSRAEADKYRKKLAADFPQQVFIISDTVEVPAVKKEKNTENSTASNKKRKATLKK